MCCNVKANKDEEGEDSTLPALVFLSFGTIYNDVYTRGIRMTTVLTKTGCHLTTYLLMLYVLCPNTGAYIGEGGKT